MNLPFEYDHLAVGEFCGTTPTSTDFDKARVVILPVPLDRTTSYVAGTRNGPHEILLASSHLELWDEETQTDVHSIGIFTLPDMEFPFATLDEVIGEIRRVASADRCQKQVSVRARRRALHHRARRRRAGRETPRPHRAADRRACRPARLVHGHAAQSRLRDAPGPGTRSRDAGRHPEPVAGRGRSGARTLPTTIFYDFNMRRDAQWIERVVDSLGETVYITIDCDGLDPAIMPAVGTPEPGGLAWYETLALLRRVIESRQVVGLRSRRAVPDPGEHRPELSVREADLQDPVVPVWLEAKGR